MPSIVATISSPGCTPFRVSLRDWFLPSDNRSVKAPSPRSGAAGRRAARCLNVDTYMVSYDILWVSFCPAHSAARTGPERCWPSGSWVVAIRVSSAESSGVPSHRSSALCVAWRRTASCRRDRSGGPGCTASTRHTSPDVSWRRIWPGWPMPIWSCNGRSRLSGVGRDGPASLGDYHAVEEFDPSRRGPGSRRGAGSSRDSSRPHRRRLRIDPFRRRVHIARPRLHPDSEGHATQARRSDG